MYLVDRWTRKQYYCGFTEHYYYFGKEECPRSSKKKKNSARDLSLPCLTYTILHFIAYARPNKWCLSS